jgi:hypothetical protein
MNKNTLLLAALLGLSSLAAHGKKLYVASTGSNTNTGTISAPFLTIQRAQTSAAAGDTVYVRGGTYMMQSSQVAGYGSPYAYVTLLNKSGSATAGRINYWAYPGERPVFNYANINPNVTNAGAPFAAPYRLSAFEVTGSYIHIRGLEVVGVRVPLVATNANTQSICFSQSGAGGNNIYEGLSMHDGQAIGFFLTRGTNNLILNCDAYRNNDNVNTASTTGTANGGNVDGFGSHPNQSTYTGNVFRGCRAWQNSDDGFDCISADAATVFENCWAFYNGYTPNFVSRGDGNGFKAGGYGTSATPDPPAVIPRNIVRNCVAAQNKSNGFYANHHLGGNDWFKNTAYRNATNYNMLNRRADYLADVPGYGHVLRNNISYAPRSAAGHLTNYDAAQCTIDYNTFLNTTVTVAANDFMSLDTTLLRAPRQPNGGLPITSFARLAPGSDLIDAGIGVGLPYSDTAPDLGAFEFAATTWTGAVSSDWFASANWTEGVPTATTEALIPVVSNTRYPVLTTGLAMARSLTIASGATLGQSGGILSLTGDLINNGTWAAVGGTLVTTGGSSQTLRGSSSLSVQNLTIGAAGAVLGTPVSFGGTLTLLGNLATNGRALTLLSSRRGGIPTDGLVVNSGGVVNGAVTVQRAIDPSLNPGPGYRHLSAPVSTATVADLATTARGGSFAPVVNATYNTSAVPTAETPFPTVFGYDENRLALANNLSGFDKGFFSPAALSDALAVGRGYTVHIGASEVVTFQGTLTSGDVPLTLPSSRASYPDGGWQLLGNPYPAPLDYSLVDPSDRAGLEDAIYVYSSTGPYAGQYRSYVNGVGNPVLPLGQAFFARVAVGQASATLTFRNSQRLAAPTSTTLQRRAASARPLVQLTLSSAGSPLTDEAIVYFEPGATNDFDSAYDAGKLPNSTGLNLATTQAGRQLSINGQATLGAGSRVVPLAVGVPRVGTYTLAASQLTNLSAVPVYLRDLQSGAVIDLHQQATYSFAVTSGTALTGRFELVFSPQQPLATVPAALAQQVVVYPNPARTQVAIELPSRLSGFPVTATLVDALGRVVRQQVLPASLATHTLPLAGISPGIYSLRLATEQGTVSKKLVME